MADKTKLYQGNDCPCPSDCHRRGNCKDCIAFHHGRGQQTYCEFLVYGSPSKENETAKSGREVRLTDYGPCAG